MMLFSCGITGRTMPGLFALLLLLSFAAIPLLIVWLVVRLTDSGQAKAPVSAGKASPDASEAGVVFFVAVLATLMIVPSLMAEVTSGRIAWTVRAIGRSVEVSAADQPAAFALGAALHLAMCCVCIGLCFKLFRDWRRKAGRR